METIGRYCELLLAGVAKLIEIVLDPRTGRGFRAQGLGFREAHHQQEVVGLKLWQSD